MNNDGIDSESYLDQHPELADELKKLFQALTLIPDLKQPEGDDIEKTDSGQELIIGDYRIIREIGSGGMGRVFEAEQVSLGRRVALKVLAPHLSISQKAVMKFHREAGAASQQLHPGIVTIFEMGEVAGIHYIAEEFIEGDSTLAQMLEDCQAEKKPQSDHFNRMAGIIANVADALACAHQSGVIHRDVKPENILLTREGLPKLSDFGLAKVEDGLTLTRTGDISGTPYYVSPEQTETGPITIDHRTDIFSLGITLYQALTLKRPFEGRNSREVMRKIQIMEPKDPRKVNPAIPRDLEIICLKALEKDRERRYQHMSDLATDLRRFLAGEPIMAKAAGIVYRSVRWIRRRKLLALSSATVLIAIVSLGLLINSIIEEGKAEERLLQSRYVSSEKAMDWEKLNRNGRPWDWYIWADPDDPAGYIMQAIYDIDYANFELANQHLEACLDRCRTRGDSSLDKDTLYLLGIVKSRLAADLPEGTARDKLRKEAQGNLDLSKAIDPGSTETLIWQSEDSPTEPVVTANGISYPSIKLNTDHFVYHLYHALNRFQIMYKGGERIEFETTIRHFKSALQTRPHNTPGLGYLGRVEYFFARFYNYPQLLEEAEYHLKEAIRHSSGHPYHLFQTSLGQIALYRGDFSDALAHFQSAIDDSRGPDNHIHNAYCGIGKVYARQGKVDEAWPYFEKALEFMHNDAYVKIAMAEACLAQGKYSEALDYAESSLKIDEGVLTIDVEMAISYLACIRARFSLDIFDQIAFDTQKIKNVAVRSPRDLCLTCFLLASVPEDKIKSINTSIPAGVASLANQAFFLNEDSPICLSARGVAAWMNSRYDKALFYLNAARNARRNWPDDIKRQHWYENARDLYFLAMTHHAMECGKKYESCNECCVDVYLQKAEELYAKHYNPFGKYADILKNVRKKAFAVLGITMEDDSD